MSTHLPPRTRVTRQVDRIQHLADWLATGQLDDYRRIAGESPTPLEEGPGLGHHDGYGPGGDKQRGGKGSHSDPTAARVERDAGGRGDNQPDTWRPAPDPTGDAVADLFAAIARAADAAVTVHRLAGYINGARTATTNRTAPQACLVCGYEPSGIGDDRLKTGLCPSDYKAWQRSPFYDTGDHLRFRRERARQIRQQEGGAA